MLTIIVVDGADADTERVRRSVEWAGVTVSTVGRAGAAGAFADAAAAGGAWTVIVTGSTAGAALEAAAEHGEISGLVLIGGQLEAQHLDLVGDWPELPILVVARTDDRPALRSAVDAYLISRHARSDLLVDATPNAEHVAAWLVSRMTDRVDVSQVVCTTPDGWEIHGTLRVPQRPDPVPGVVLLPSGRSDRAAYARLERLLSEQGLAVLNIDWRGRGGASTSAHTSSSTMPPSSPPGRTLWRPSVGCLPTRESMPIGWLASGACTAPSTRCVPPGATGVSRPWWYLPGTARTNRRSTAADQRRGRRDVRQRLRSHDHGAGDARVVPAGSRGRAHMIEYPVSALGYQLFEIDHELEPRIATWLTRCWHERHRDRVRGGGRMDDRRHRALSRCQRYRARCGDRAGIVPRNGRLDTGRIDARRARRHRAPDRHTGAAPAPAARRTRRWDRRRDGGSPSTWRQRSIALPGSRVSTPIASDCCSSRTPLPTHSKLSPAMPGGGDCPALDPARRPRPRRRSPSRSRRLRAGVERGSRGPACHGRRVSAAAPTNSKLDVFRGLGVGITMASVLQFEGPNERQLDTRLANRSTDALDDRLARGPSSAMPGTGPVRTDGDTIVPTGPPRAVGRSAAPRRRRRRTVRRAFRRRAPDWPADRHRAARDDAGAGRRRAQEDLAGAVAAGTS